MKFIKTKIPEVVIIEPKVFGDNRGYFMEAGGKEFSYIPALNDRDDHIQALSSIIEQQL